MHDRRGEMCLLTAAASAASAAKARCVVFIIGASQVAWCIHRGEAERNRKKTVAGRGGVGRQDQPAALHRPALHSRANLTLAKTLARLVWYVSVASDPSRVCLADATDAGMTGNQKAYREDQSVHSLPGKGYSRPLVSELAGCELPYYLLPCSA